MGLISRWASTHRCFKVQYGAVLLMVIVISFFGTGKNLAGNGIGVLQIIGSKQEVKYSKFDMVEETPKKENMLEEGSPNFNNASESRHWSGKHSKILAPNVPDELVIMENKVLVQKYGTSFPFLTDIRISNKYWQYLNVFNGVDIYIFSAFYDNRKIFKRKAFVRVLAMVSHIDVDVDLYCKFWSRKNKKKSRVSLAELRSVVYMKTSALNTYIISCEVPLQQKGDIPFAVSLVENRKDKATNLLHVNNNLLEKGDSKQDFAICHKGLDFPFYDNSLKLVEWIELTRILGASKIFFYEFHIHPNISKVLQYYTEKGLVEVTPLTLPGDQPNTPKELNEYLRTNFKTQLCHEKLPYNDCYFKNMNKYKYILNIDIDEILIPQSFNTWKELVTQINTNLKSSGKDHQPQYIFERFISLESMLEPHGFVKDIPHSMFMLQNIYRADEFQKCPKSFFNTDIAIGTSTHTTDFCKSKCSEYHVPTDMAKIIHYRSSCKGKDSTCEPKNSVKDTAIWRYKDEVISRTTNVLKILELI